MTDEKIKAAKAHWSGRMVSNGMPLADFQDVTTQTQSWDDWCIALSNRGDIHAGLGSESEERGFLLSAGEHYVTAAICYHFGKFLFVNRGAAIRKKNCSIGQRRQLADCAELTLVGTCGHVC